MIYMNTPGYVSQWLILIQNSVLCAKKLLKMKWSLTYDVKHSQQTEWKTIYLHLASLHFKCSEYEHVWQIKTCQKQLKRSHLHKI